MRSHGVVRGGIIVPVIIPPVVDVLVVPVVEDVLVAVFGLLGHQLAISSFRPEREARAARLVCASMIR